MDINWNKIVILLILFLSIVLIYMIYDIFFKKVSKTLELKQDNITDERELFNDLFEAKYNLLLLDENPINVDTNKPEYNLKLRRLEKVKNNYQENINYYNNKIVFSSLFEQKRRRGYRNKKANFERLLANINEQIDLISGPNSSRNNVTKSNTYKYNLDSPALISEIIFESPDKIPLDLNVVVINTKLNIKQTVNMDKYKIDKSINKFYTYTNNQSNLLFTDMLDVNGNPLFGDQLIFSSSSIIFVITKLVVFGNSNKLDAAQLDIKNSLEINMDKLGKNVNFIITQITISNASSSPSKYKIKYTNTIEEGEHNYNGPVNNKFYVTSTYNNIYCFKKLLVNTITILTENDVVLSDDNYLLYGYIPDSNDIQSYKFEKGLISFKDSLNPDSVCSYNKLKEGITTSESIIDILNYQDNINYEINELDKNRYNLLELENQKLATANLVNRINTYSDKYITLLKNNDEYNINKYNEAKDTVDGLKSILEERLNKQPTGNIDVNIDIIEEE